MIARLVDRRPNLVMIVAAGFLAVWATLLLGPVLGQDLPDPNAPIQALLRNPWVLYGLMLFGSIVSMWKQWQVAKMDGSTATVGSYLGHLQELFITLGGNTLVFFALADSGNLNYLSAVSIGYVINSAADLNPLGGRSSALK